MLVLQKIWKLNWQYRYSNFSLSFWPRAPSLEEWINRIVKEIFLALLDKKVKKEAMQKEAIGKSNLSSKDSQWQDEIFSVRIAAETRKPYVYWCFDSAD